MLYPLSYEGGAWLKPSLKGSLTLRRWWPCWRKGSPPPASPLPSGQHETLSSRRARWVMRSPGVQWFGSTWLTRLWRREDPLEVSYLIDLNPAV